MSDEQRKLTDLISGAHASTSADFYRALWGKKQVFSELPTVAREDFLRVPLSRRRYKNERGLVKIVHNEERAFFNEWSFSDIGAESYGLISKRPLVYLSDPHEAIEKSVWCYEKGMLPLIGEKDPAIAMFAASKYRIDSLITDVRALEKFRPFFENFSERLSSISLLGTAFNPEELAPYSAHTKKLRLVLALPETGAFAEAEFSPTPRFRTLPGCIVEREKTLVVTKTSLLVTPVIRYRTNVPVSLYDGA